MPGSALASVEAIAPMIQEACEKALFTGPETAAAAVVYRYPIVENVAVQY
jgi:hypothetical protein